VVEARRDVQSGEDLRAERDDGFDGHAKDRLHAVENLDLEGVSHGQAERPASRDERHHRVPAQEVDSHGEHSGRVNLGRVDAYEGEQELCGERAPDLFLGAEACVDQHGSQTPAPAGLLGKRGLEPHL
jgi:hypothetical protein